MCAATSTPDAMTRGTILPLPPQEGPPICIAPDAGTPGAITNPPPPQAKPKAKPATQGGNGTKSPESLNIEIRDDGFKGVLQLSDHVVVREGEIETSMPVRNFLTSNRFLKGQDARQRLAVLSQKNSNLVHSFSLDRYVAQLMGPRQPAAVKPAKSRVIGLGKGTVEGVLDQEDTLVIRRGKNEVKVGLTIYLKSDDYKDHGSPQKRLQALTRLGRGQAISPGLQAYVDGLMEAQAQPKPVVTVEETGDTGILQAEDQVLIRTGEESREVSVKEFISSDDFKAHGTPRERLALLATQHEFAIAKPLEEAVKVAEAQKK